MLMKRIVFIVLILFTTACFAENYWVWFADKGFENGSTEEFIALREAEKSLSERAMTRRIKARGEGNIVDFRDIAPSEEYIAEVSRTGAEIRVASRVLNAVSITAQADALEKIAKLPFVERISPLAKRIYTPEPSGHYEMVEIADYGNSFAQNSTVNSPFAHRLGLHGEGVLICVTDTGFKLDHEAMADADILGYYDFVDDDSVVTIEPGDPLATETHGTKVWSIIAGNSPGNLIGIAHEASFLLARTEHYDLEYPGEEDHWIAAAEWADSLGADIITLSLGYYEWYSADSMTGDIAPISIAADRMAENGIVITAAAGNRGMGYNTLVAPGDADSIITVGAVNADGSIAGFSSRGPTADGRIKPEICAMGAGVWSATSSTTNSYGSSFGTSASTPIAAGLAAILLQARPYLLPMDVREALMMTASNRTSPNNNIGWGVPDIRAALSYPVGGGAEIPVFRGWNFISLPVVGTLSIDSAFPGRVGEVWRWNPSLSEYEAVSSIEGGEAYFVFYESARLLSISGAPLTSISKPAGTGWNTIGGIRPKCFLSAIETSSTADLDVVLYKWDSIEQNYIQSKTLSPGEGAFVLVFAGGNINITE